MTLCGEAGLILSAETRFLVPTGSAHHGALKASVQTLTEPLMRLLSDGGDAKGTALRVCWAYPGLPALATLVS